MVFRIFKRHNNRVDATAGSGLGKRATITPRITRCVVAKKMAGLGHYEKKS